VRNVYGDFTVDADAPDGWDDRYRDSWRRVGIVAFPGRIISLICNSTYWNEGCGHTEGYECVGYARDIGYLKGDWATEDNRGSHPYREMRPAAFMDGHAETLSGRKQAWFTEPGLYSPGWGTGTWRYYAPEVDHLMWMIRPGEFVRAAP
jgi:hypothetical protein